jgi:hypothetical protein
VVEPFSFPSRLPCVFFPFFFFFLHSFIPENKRPTSAGWEIFGRYHAHTWLFDLCWDRKDSFFESASGCKIS